MSRVEDYRKLVNGKLAERKVLRRKYKKKVTQLETHEQQAIHITEAHDIIQCVSQAIQEEAHQQIAKIVSKCLSTVFDEPYTFLISFQRKRNRTEASLKFERGGVMIDPMTASGGGVVDVASFALRLSCILLNKPKLRRIMILDEPFKFVSSEYRGRIKEMLEVLSGELRIQFIMVTHIPELVTGKQIIIDGTRTTNGKKKSKKQSSKKQKDKPNKKKIKKGTRSNTSKS